MRIGIVTPRYPPAVAGGGEISVKLLADHLVSHGCDVEVFSFDGASDESVNDVPVTRFRHVPNGLLEVANVYALGGLYRVRHCLRRCDVLHAYNIALNPAVGVVGELLAVPTVATLNSYDLLPKAAFGVRAGPKRRLYELLAMPTTGRLLRRAIRKIDRFVTLSEASREVYRRNGFRDVPIDVVPNMLDPEFSVPDCGCDTKHRTLLFVGSLIREKGVEYLIRAMVSLPSDVRLRIVGSGERGTALRSLSADLAIEDRVTFTGHVPYEELREEYATADVFVHPGIWPEPFGRTLLEAMQAGLPVVTTDIGGPAEIVREDRFRCPPRDPEALARTIERALHSPEQGAANFTSVRERYAPEVVLEQLLNIYAEAIG